MAKISPKSLGYFFLEKKFAQHHKKSPKWRNFAKSGPPAASSKYQKNA
jgi:hypothetical protein